MAHQWPLPELQPFNGAALHSPRLRCPLTHISPAHYRSVSGAHLHQKVSNRRKTHSTHPLRLRRRYLSPSLLVSCPRRTVMRTSQQQVASMSCPTRHRSASHSLQLQETAQSTLTHPWSRGVAVSSAMNLDHSISLVHLARHSVRVYRTCQSSQQTLSASDQASSVAWAVPCNAEAALSVSTETMTKMSSRTHNHRRRTGWVTVN